MSRLSIIAFALTLIGVSGCDSSSSPTEVDQAPSAISVLFINTEAIAEHEELIRSLLEDVAARAAGALDLGMIQVTVTVDAGRAIPGWGIGGYALGPTEIEIVVDPGFPGLDQVLIDRLPHIAAHEMHHAVRWCGPGPYATLLEALVFEGMADHFGREVVGAPLPPWTQAFPRRETVLYLERARPEFDRTFDFEAWFFGVATDLPVWTGYTLGYRLVGDYLAANPGTSAASLVDTPAEALRPPA